MNLKILFCGDIMPGGVLPYQAEYISREVKDYLDSFDLRVGTLESAIGTGLPYDDVKMQGRANIVYARNEDFYRVKEMGFNVVSLANNHVFDLGKEGLENTIKILKENRIQYCGAGMNLEEASKPVFVEYEGLKLAFIACCMMGFDYLGYVPIATKDGAGVNPLDMNLLLNSIKKAKIVSDYVFVLPHWGLEYNFWPIEKTKKLAYKMIDAGADAVLGSHAHNVNPVVYYKNKPIYFCMGNFLFPDYYMQPPRPIWYPTDKNNLSAIKKVVGYPREIQEPMVSVWNDISRVGMIVSLIVGKNGPKYSYKFVKLSKENILNNFGIVKTLGYKFFLFCIGLMFKFKHSSFLKRCYFSRYNLLRRGYNYINKI